MKNNSSNGKKAFEKISILINLILIPLILIAASYAWFSENNDVSAKGMTVAVEKGVKIDAALVSYGILDITDSLYTADTSVEKYDLPLHDPNGILFSKYELALLIKIELTADTPTNAELYAKTAVNTIPLEKDTIKNNYISNCITLTPVTYDEATKIATKPTTGTLSFTSADTDGIFIKSSTELLLFSGEITTETKTLYFLMEYNEPFLEFLDPYVMQHWLTDPTVTYSNDLMFTVRGE